MRVLYLARHGETEWNALGRLQGANDVPLNERGREQALALGAALSREGIVRVTASDLSRARQTGEVVARRLGVRELAIDPELRERSFGPFEGLTRRASSVAPPGAEETSLVVARMKRALLRCFDRGGPLLVVSHGAAMRLVLSELTGETVAPIANGAIYRLEDRRGTFEVQAWPARAG